MHNAMPVVAFHAPLLSAHGKARIVHHRGAALDVAIQVSNLPYRRFPIGRASPPPKLRDPGRSDCGLKTRDTGDRKSALPRGVATVSQNGYERGPDRRPSPVA